MLRMNMTQAEKDLVNIHKAGLKIYPGYTCNCCNQAKPRHETPLVDVFRPPKGIRMRTKEWAATFVICPECQKLPDEKITKGVLAGFLQRGLAVVRGT